jgi:putative ABC transport system ATP-binding protein
MPEPVLECRRIGHVFGAGALGETVLRDVSLAFAAGERCVLMGPSGSGKTTLLSILGCLLSPTSGELILDGERVNHERPGSLSALRRQKIGFVFQHAQLLPFLSLYENLAIVGRNSGLQGDDLKLRLNDLLERLGIAELRKKLPHQASGGQRQRFAIARAVLHRPAILLADEPTAALDWQNGEAAVRLLVEQAQREGTLLITVTHDARLLPLFERTLHIANGQVAEGCAV